MFNTFPFFRQHDAMDCGPTCLRMIAQHYGKSYSLAYLREHSYLSRDGVSMLGISEAADNIGFRTIAVKIPYVSNSEKAGLIQAPLPCIVHWQQRHFIVVHKINKKYVWVADPADGAYKIPRSVFEASWLSDKGEGVALLVEPTPKFYEEDVHDRDAINRVSTRVQKPKGFGFLFSYLTPFRPMLFQVFLAMLLGSIFQLILPFLTQSIVDVGISNRNIGFIWLILMAQLVLFTSRTIVDFIQNKVILHISTRINVALINDYLTKLMRLPLGFFDTKMTGDLMQRIGDHHRIEEFLTRHTLMHAVKMANIQEFIETLPLGYNTVIGAKGNGISQGQKQRLLIARAIYKNPNYLFFDEATNSLDANNEKVIINNMKQFYKGRTVVVVAHRLSTVRHADQIIVLDKGRVVEMGTHAELVDDRKNYYELVRNQLELGG